ncbi:hypothetical protein BGZ83_000318 [Gryganskiella cystojenkinii]|nr:hypothetical protein BGZ83_000318 [Gryganskiella cystojenkinii]
MRIITDASPIKHPDGFVIPLIRRENFKHDTIAHIAKANRRYNSGLKVLAGGSTGREPLVNFSPDVEFYGNVSIGTPAQVLKLYFDTSSSDIWFPSTSCANAACSVHTRFDPAKSSTYKKDSRTWTTAYGALPPAGGTVGSDIVNVAGISVRQTFGLATTESSPYQSFPEDGYFGLGFETLDTISGVQTFMENAIVAGLLAQPIFSVFLASERLFHGQGGQILFGGIDKTKYIGTLTYVPVTTQGYWQILIQDAFFNGVSLGQAATQGIIDTGSTLLLIGNAAAAAIHAEIPGATNSATYGGWLVPCASTAANTGHIGFKLGGTTFSVPITDLAFEDVGDGSGNCYSGVQGGQDGLWVLGDVFMKNNYCVFSQTSSPSVGIAPIKH